MRRLVKSTTPKKKHNPDAPYLSYYDVRLTYEDYKTIKNDWLTDNAISFFEEYLERERLINFPKSKVVLLRPSMAYMIMTTPDPVAIRDALPNFDETTHIFLPINNNPNPWMAEGGSHWSLLLISLIDELAFHYDSLDNTNLQEAKLVTRRFEQMLGGKYSLRFRTINRCPQQTNNADCGVYVCLFMEKLLFDRLLKADTMEPVSMRLENQRFNAHDKRLQMLNMIGKLRKDAPRPKLITNTKSTDPPRISEETRKLVPKPADEWLRLIETVKTSKSRAASVSPFRKASAVASPVKRRRTKLEISGPSAPLSSVSDVETTPLSGNTLVNGRFPASSVSDSSETPIHSPNAEAYPQYPADSKAVLKENKPKIKREKKPQRLPMIASLMMKPAKSKRKRSLSLSGSIKTEGSPRLSMIQKRAVGLPVQ